MSRLRAAREHKNLTQEELSEKSRISVRTIQRIEALEIEETVLQNVTVAPEVNDEVGSKVISEVEEEQVSEVNYSPVKIINLSSLLLSAKI